MSANVNNKIYFGRHGQTEANVANILAGNSETKLTNEGVRQADMLAQEILEKGIPIKEILTSRLGRAVDTASIVAYRLGLPTDHVHIVNGLHERDGGTYQGRSLDEFYKANDQAIRLAGGEATREFADRVGQVQQYINNVSADVDGNVLVVGHAEFYRIARALASKLPVDSAITLPKPKNATLYEFPDV